jgi:hypothetical protein
MRVHEAIRVDLAQGSGVLFLDCRDHRLAERDDLLDGRLLRLLAKNGRWVCRHRAGKWVS